MYPTPPPPPPTQMHLKEKPPQAFIFIYSFISFISFMEIGWMEDKPNSKSLGKFG